MDEGEGSEGKVEQHKQQGYLAQWTEAGSKLGQPFPQPLRALPLLPTAV